MLASWHLLLHIYIVGATEHLSDESGDESGTDADEEPYEPKFRQDWLTTHTWLQCDGKAAERLPTIIQHNKKI